MIIEYNGQIFNAEISGEQVCIWKYTPVEGFQKITTDRGTIYYEKSIPIEETDEFFGVEFLAFIGRRRFVITSLDGNNVNVLCDDAEYAKSNRFTEIEHGVWITKNELNDFDEFQLVKHIENCDDKHVIDIDKSQLSELWKKYVKEVNI